ncbi:hypothetical protein BBF96_15300 [Anoxybacter fermentans]|uniref:Glutamate decarboxylase n=1 Tax=Anoxybacter fermentans TaxID=1323375 RepID=A0A3Q9HSK1_9FIRM|nr:glutamate decarboxylase [Anoxybacter fermentans]AZR74620.1 hypothetical protein BBF96_15300 [Anoxybacter fermentans]
MWQVVYIASNKKQAENMKNRLIQEGFLVKIEPMGSKESDGYQILVPEGEALEVADFLSQSYDY